MQDNKTLSPFIVPFFKEVEILLKNFETDKITHSVKNKSFPPTDIFVPTNENKSIIQMAIAGFTQDEITFELGFRQLNNHQKLNILTVHGKKSEEFKEKRRLAKESGELILDGISYKNIKKEFIVFDNIESIEPQIKDGVLTIEIIEKQIQEKSLKINFKK
jgi:HSP20 family molecular chaperone IbpA